MRKILKFLFVFIAAGALLNSCEEVETNHALLTNPPDINATYYFQFKDSEKSLETGVNDAGELVNIESQISVALMGLPLNEETVIPLTIDPSSTIAPNMYTLSATSIIIPAGKTSGSITLTSIVEEMPIEENLKLVISIDEGEHNAPAGTTLNYDMFRINFCPLDLTQVVGTWEGTDSWGYASEVVTEIDGDGNFIINGIGFGWFQDWWGEVIVTNTPVIMDVNPVTGEFTISEQPYITSTWGGDPQPAYGLSGSGKIDACNKVITLDYIYHQAGGTFDGTAWGSKFKEVITLK
ncbi:MAG: hypothetical protein GQ525_15485 [Draconibacterium sp.]|nr:hypothetical protein [Draconibacterium sp.]